MIAQPAYSPNPLITAMSSTAKLEDLAGDAYGELEGEYRPSSGGVDGRVGITSGVHRY
jgi:hypothetical protein